MGAMRLDDKVVLLTGGTDGIGLVLAGRLIDEGARAVVVTGRNAERGKLAAERLGERAIYLRQDVTDEGRWEEVMGEVLERFGRLDVLVNNAGWIGTGEVQSPEETSLKEWQEIFAVNLDGSFLGCRAGIKAMKAGGGAIVNMSSTAGLLSTASFCAYGAAKAAVAHLTKSVAIYCAKHGYGIRCNSVHPAIIDDTAMRDTIFRLYGEDVEASRAGYLARVPLGTLGTPEDVAGAVVYLASDDSKYVTGSQLVVGGGIGV
jgi:3(or 17)beta-hydroxysteroid dehydrogenase